MNTQIITASLLMVAFSATAYSAPKAASSTHATLSAEAMDASATLIANAKRGETLWKKSCRAAINGVCAVQRKRLPLNTPIAKRCGQADAVYLQRKQRNPRLHKQARTLFSAAENSATRFAKRFPDQKLSSEAKQWLAASQFYLLEDKYENYLDLQFPKGLNYPENNTRKNKASVAAFKVWLTQKHDLHNSLEKQYRLQIKNPSTPKQWQRAAQARIASLATLFAQELQTGEVPPSVRSGQYAKEASEAYCEALQENAEPLQKKANEEKRRCSAFSNSSAKWSIQCPAS